MARRSTSLAIHISARDRIEPVRDWTTLEELREVAFSHGFAPAQFAYAVEVMGTDPYQVANYLQRHEFFKSLPRAALKAG